MLVNEETLIEAAKMLCVSVVVTATIALVLYLLFCVFSRKLSEVKRDCELKAVGESRIKQAEAKRNRKAMNRLDNFKKATRCSDGSK